MAGHKRSAIGSLTIEGLLEDVTIEELEILRLVPYEDPGTFSGKREKLAQKLVERQLLELNREALGYHVRCTERGMAAAGVLTLTATRKICKRLRELMKVNDLCLVEHVMSLLMYRCIGEYSDRETKTWIEITRWELDEKLFQLVIALRDDVEEARAKAKADLKRSLVKIERVDPFDAIREKHHPNEVLSSDFENGEPPFDVEVDDEMEEP